MQIKHTNNQNNIQDSKKHDYREIKIISRKIHNNNGRILFFIFFFFEGRLCVPHRFRLRFTPPPHTPMKDSSPVLLVCRGTEKRTKHGESIAYPEQLRRLKLTEYLDQTSVYDKYCMQLSPCMRMHACLGVIN